MQTCKVGLQLYSVQVAMKENLPGTLKAVKEMGYDFVEFVNLFGRSAAEIRSICDEIGLEILTYSWDTAPLLEAPNEVISMLHGIDAKNFAVGCSADDLVSRYDECVDRLTRASILLHENNLQLLYHNHDREFVLQKDGMPMLKALCRDVPYLLPELDACWVLYGGFDPTAAISLFPGMPLVHLKDFVCNNLPCDFDFVKNASGSMRSRPEDGFLYRPLGCGCVDIPAVLRAAEEAEIPYIIVEQDWDFMESCLKDAAKSRDYLRSLGY